MVTKNVGSQDLLYVHVLSPPEYVKVVFEVPSAHKKQNGSFLKYDSESFDQMSVIYGYHIPK
jgi:hypothetical protein